MADEAELRAALLRFQAALHDRTAMHLRLAAASTIAASKIEQLAAAMQDANDAELAAHPDVAELNVQMDGYFGAPS